ncbi:PemK-like protein [compost metagenome]
MLAITRTGRQNPILVPIPAMESGLPEDSFVHAGQVLTVDRSRFLDRAGRATPAVMTRVDQAIRVSLGL